LDGRSRRANQEPPVAFLQSSGVRLTKPWPRQAFWPAHSLFAVWHSLKPLQALAPWQAIVASVVPGDWLEVPAQPDTNKVAADIATAIPSSLLDSMGVSLAHKVVSVLGTG